MATLGDLSRLINRLLLGDQGQTLCARISIAFGPACIFCKLISAVLREHDHCQTEMDHWLKSKR